MAPAWRWLIGLGWGIPLAVAAVVTLSSELPAHAPPLARAGTVLLLTAPVLPLSLILLALAAVAGHRTRRVAGSELRRADVVLLQAAMAGIAVGLALVTATVALYVT